MPTRSSESLISQPGDLSEGSHTLLCISRLGADACADGSRAHVDSQEIVGGLVKVLDFICQY